MKLTELVTTARGRKATAKLAWDLGKITGKVAVAGTAGFLGAMATGYSSHRDEPEEDWFADTNFEVIEDGHHPAGPEGAGYYVNGFRVGD
ncbi:MAG: hypothetical protein HRU39_02875 [Salinicola sp.]|uniref:hypothetical protein n=1 Tax=Salinicola sp. TaxID=1978524 RepID=UPI001D48B3A4|nr:hypothetical protein [Salinicola sp.]NRB54912.1 hypothetical protein [Salinicola sp.]